MIPAGILRHRVTIQQRVTASPQKTPSGQPAESWADLVTVDANVSPLSGRELFAAQEHHSEVTTLIRLRHRDGLTAKMRVSFRGLIYHIKHVKYLQDFEEVQLMCGQGVTEQ